MSHVVKYLLHLWLYFTTTTYSWIFFYLLEMRIYIQHYWGLPQKCSIKCQKREARGKLNCKKGPFQLKLLLADLISLWDCHDDIDILLGVLFFPYFIPWLIFRVGKRTLKISFKKVHIRMHDGGIQSLLHRINFCALSNIPLPKYLPLLKVLWSWEF